MDIREARRLAVSRQMMVRLARQDFRAKLRADGLTGERVVHVLLLDDTVGLMCEKVRDSDGPSVVLIADGDSRTVNIIHVRAGNHDGSDGSSSELVSGNAKLEMLLNVMKIAGTSEFKFLLTEDGTTVAMVGRGEKLQV